MSICSECLNPKTIARCVTNLNVGSVDAVSSTVYVYIRDITVDSKVRRYTVAVSDEGAVQIAINPNHFSEDHTYEMWITLITADNIETKENITMAMEGGGNQTGDCISFRVENIWDENNISVGYEFQTFTI